MKLEDGYAGIFQIEIVGEITAETADEVRRLFDEERSVACPDGSKTNDIYSGYTINSPGLHRTSAPKRCG
jgi:hypothetical protein